MKRRTINVSSIILLIAASILRITGYVPLVSSRAQSLALFVAQGGLVYSTNLPRSRRAGLPRYGGLLCRMSQSNSSSSTEVSSADQKKQNHRISRPERKALERQRKEGAKNNKSRRATQTASQQRTKGTVEEEGPYDLHSTAVSSLNIDSTPDDVIRAIKRAQNMHDEHDIRNIERFLLEEVDDKFAYGYRGSLLARLAVAALHMDNHELARVALQVRRTEHRSSMLPLESAAVIRGLLRVHNVADAMMILYDELSLPLQGTQVASLENRERVKYRALALASIASRHFYGGVPVMAVQACEMLRELGPIARDAKLLAEDIGMPWLRIIQGATQCESKRRDQTIQVDAKDEEVLPCNLVYSVLDAMNTFPSENDDQLYEALSNALVRRVVFVTGAVDMSGLPPADRGEVAFIGRR